LRRGIAWDSLGQPAKAAADMVLLLTENAENKHAQDCLHRCLDADASLRLNVVAELQSVIPIKGDDGAEEARMRSVDYHVWFTNYSSCVKTACFYSVNGPTIQLRNIRTVFLCHQDWFYVHLRNRFHSHIVKENLLSSLVTVSRTCQRCTYILIRVVTIHHVRHYAVLHAIKGEHTKLEETMCTCVFIYFT
jgi:hypothetical protein